MQVCLTYTKQLKLELCNGKVELFSPRAISQRSTALQANVHGVLVKERNCALCEMGQDYKKSNILQFTVMYSTCFSMLFCF